MAEPYLSEIRIFGFNFAPRNWAQCDGQILPINQNQSLYSLLGTTYGGDGRTSFALPDLRGRAAIHKGTTITLGAKSGSESVVLTTDQIPSHDHTLQATNDDSTSPLPPQDNFLARATTPLYHTATNLVALKATDVPAVGKTGGSQGHNNMQPFQALNFCIAISGLFPSRN